MLNTPKSEKEWEYPTQEYCLKAASGAFDNPIPMIELKDYPMIPESLFEKVDEVDIECFDKFDKSSTVFLKSQNEGWKPVHTREDIERYARSLFESGLFTEKQCKGVVDLLCEKYNIKD